MRWNKHGAEEQSMLEPVFAYLKKWPRECFFLSCIHMNKTLFLHGSGALNSLYTSTKGLSSMHEHVATSPHHHFLSWAGVLVFCLFVCKQRLLKQAGLWGTEAKTICWFQGVHVKLREKSELNCWTEKQSRLLPLKSSSPFTHQARNWEPGPRACCFHYT